MRHISFDYQCQLREAEADSLVITLDPVLHAPSAQSYHCLRHMAGFMVMVASSFSLCNMFFDLTWSNCSFIAVTQFSVPFLLCLLHFFKCSEVYVVLHPCYQSWHQIDFSVGHLAGLFKRLLRSQFSIHIGARWSLFTLTLYHGYNRLPRGAQSSTAGHKPEATSKSYRGRHGQGKTAGGVCRVSYILK